MEKLETPKFYNYLHPPPPKKKKKLSNSEMLRCFFKHRFFYTICLAGLEGVSDDALNHCNMCVLLTLTSERCFTGCHGDIGIR